MEEARRNLAQWGDKVEFNQVAVWKSGEYEPVGYDWYEPCPGCSFTFASNEPTALKTVGLDALIMDAIHDGTPIDLAKIDVEGAEYQILYTSKLLPYIKRMRMEVHNLPAFGIAGGTLCG